MATELSEANRWRIYELSVYMAWSDRRLAAAEVSTARAIAEELALSGASDGGKAGALLRDGARPLGELGLERLPIHARHLAYATAAFMALADGIEHPAERAVLRTLQHRMRIDEDTAAWLLASALLSFAQGTDAALRTRFRSLLRAVADVTDPELLDVEALFAAALGAMAPPHSRQEEPA